MVNIKMPTEAIEVKGVVTLLYGQCGIGKTTWSLTSPKSLLLDFDNGIRRVQPKDRRPYVPIYRWQDAIDVLNSDLSDYDTIVIDTVGMALDFLSQQIISENPKMGMNGDLSLKGFGLLKNRFRSFVGLCKTRGKHIVFVAHDKEQMENEQRYVRPDITGSSLNLVTREADLVGYMEAQGNRRTISFTPTSKSYGKNSGGLPDIIELSKMSLEDVFNVYNDVQNQHIELLSSYEALVSVIEENVATINDGESAENVAKLLEKLETIWDSKLYARSCFKNKLQELGLKYNATTKEYEKAV
jgi:phage nucleotide-binding protein